MTERMTYSLAIKEQIDISDNFAGIRTRTLWRGNDYPGADVVEQIEAELMPYPQIAMDVHFPEEDADTKLRIKPTYKHFARSTSANYAHESGVPSEVVVVDIEESPRFLIQKARLVAFLPVRTLCAVPITVKRETTWLTPKPPSQADLEAIHQSWTDLIRRQSSTRF